MSVRTKFVLGIQKLALWDFATAASRDYSDIPELPSVTWDDLPADIQQEIRKAERERPWERCAQCGNYGDVYPLKQCAGCSHIRGKRTLYCSRICARKGWPSHKKDCLEKETNELETLTGRGLYVSAIRRCFRKWPRREEGLKMPVTWVWSQITQHQPELDEKQLDVKKFSLGIVCSTLDTGNGGLAVESFTVITDEEDPEPWNGDPFIIARFIIDNITIDPVAFTLEHLKATDWNNWYFPQWPWIFATLILYGDNNQTMASLRIATILRVLDPLRTCKCFDNPLLSFQAGLLRPDETYGPQGMNNWHIMMGHVTAGLHHAE